MTSKQLADRALSLADLQNSLFITHEDIVNSLNESYKDVYSRITGSGDDFYVNSSVVTVDGSTMAGNGPFEFLVPLPADLYKLRTVDYKYNGAWQNMKKFSLSFRNKNPSEPQYRFQGNKLWIIGSNMGSSNFEIRINYYPPAEEITVPDVPLYFGSAITSTNINAITSPYYANIRLYNGTGMVENRLYFYISGIDGYIYVENYDAKTVVSITSLPLSGAKNLVYYSGKLYVILNDAKIYSAEWQPGNTTVNWAALASGPTGVTSFQIETGLIIYSTAANTYSIPVAGPFNAPSLLIAKQTLAFTYVGNYPCYLDSTGKLFLNNVDNGGFYTALATDDTYLWVLNNQLQLIKLLVDFTLNTVQVIQVTQDVKAVGNVISNRIPLIGYENPVFMAQSTESEYDFTYPMNANETIEIMAYQMAIDFRGKQSQNVTQLMVRKEELDTRFNETIRKDDYSVEKIRHAYAGQIGVTGNGW